MLHVREVFDALLPVAHSSRRQDGLADGVEHPNVEDRPVLPEPRVSQRRADQPGRVAHELEGVEHNGARTLSFLIIENESMNKDGLLV